METKAELKALSASRIKTLESCSWLYWCNYQLKLPQVQNDGAKKGDICHRIFELLLNPKHKTTYSKIVKAKTITKVHPIEKLVTLYAKQLELKLTGEVLVQLDEMILVGLESDFFIKGAKLIEAEFKFDLQNQSPRYYIKGFMDKPFMTDKEVIIDDFKSSKKKFEGEDQESNVQAMIYSLAAKKLWPDKSPTVRFIFLQFPDDPMMKLSFSEDTLKGFEYYLASVQERIDRFGEADAKSSFAYDMPDAKGGEFKGKLMCGFARSPTELKKDGTKKWHCPYKFAFDYWVVYKPDGAIRTSAFDKDKVNLKEGERIEKKRYDGCPRFNGSSNALNNFEMPAVQKTAETSPKRYINVLNDF
jgi:hypothetical protein